MTSDVRNDRFDSSAIGVINVNTERCESGAKGAGGRTGEKSAGRRTGELRIGEGGRLSGDQKCSGE